MKKLLYLFLSALVMLAVSCKKQPSEASAYSSVQKQWLITVEGEEEYCSIYDYAVEPGNCFRISEGWRNLPDATYLVDEHSIYPCTYSVADGVYHLDIKVYGDGSPEVRYYEEFSNVTETTASFKSVYHDSSRDIVENGRAEVVKHPVKIVRNPMSYVTLRRMGWIWYTLRASVQHVKQFEAMASQKTSWEMVVLDGTGLESEYAGKDVSGKMVAVHYAFPKVGASETGLTIAERREIAARKGAVALIIMYTMDSSSPLTLEQYNTLPQDTKSIPIALFASENSLVTSGYDLIFD